ncbi:MAG: rubrerythrin family protein [Muribaculaceae bacterium]|nr:rubrerythrin family protein [Muribaculaceae bacterium]
MATTAKSIRGTKTEQNLANSYMAESAAYTRYTFFSQQAQKEGYYQYANIFAETAANELHHSKIYFKYLTEGAVVTAPLSVDAGIIGTTAENLKVAAAEEQSEGVDSYINAAKVAEEEGFTEIAARFRAIASVEAHHEARFNKMRERIENGTVWKRDTPIKWQCLVCGYIYEGTTPPEKCPACYHPYQHFMPMEDNI